VLRERNRIRLETVCLNQRGEDVLTGEAWVMPSRESVVLRAAPVRARRAPRPATLGVGGPRPDRLGHPRPLDADRGYINKPPLIDTSAPVM
jgi:hypothetical protein